MFDPRVNFRGSLDPVTLRFPRPSLYTILSTVVLRVVALCPTFAQNLLFEKSKF